MGGREQRDVRPACASPLTVIMTIWSLEGPEKQVKASRREIKDLLTQDESMKKAWEANFKDK